MSWQDMKQYTCSPLRSSRQPVNILMLTQEVNCLNLTTQERYITGEGRFASPLLVPVKNHKQNHTTCRVSYKSVGQLSQTGITEPTAGPSLSNPPSLFSVSSFWRLSNRLLVFWHIYKYELVYVTEARSWQNKCTLCPPY